MTDATAPAAAKPLFSEGYKRLALALLLAAYTFNFIDRTIISTIGPKIREDLHLTNNQLGLLGGLWFALLYTLLGIPIARLAERFSRVWIISAALVIWSGFTALCGGAGSYAVLAACRFGVGVGEAGCSPPAHSLISDYFEPKKRASALSIYSFGIPLGTMIGAVAGGWLATTFSWRLTFVIVGLPGLLIALLVRMLMREPPRGHADVVQAEHPGLAEDVTAHAAEPPATGSWISREIGELAAVAKTLFTKWPVVNMVLGVTIASFGSYGGGAFSSQFFYAGYHLSLAQVGLITGLVGGFSSGVGTLVGGFLSDRLSQRSPAWYSLTPAFGLAIATPIYIFAYMQPTMKLAAMVLLVPGIFHYTYLGPTFGVVQNMVETRRRATATALMFFFLNLIALGGGPPFIGWLIDQLADFNFAHGGGRGTLDSVLGLFGAHGADFQAQCPGGIAPKTAGADLQTLCLATLANSSRQGVIVSIFFYAWASIHYFLGAIGLSQALAKARAERGEAD